MKNFVESNVVIYCNLCATNYVLKHQFSTERLIKTAHIKTYISIETTNIPTLLNGN